MKKFSVITFVLLSLCVFNLKAYDIPGVRNPNNTKILLLPDNIGQEVAFEFDKRDVNGYVGTDPIVLSVLSPSGKNVCEVMLPDDGNIGNKWKIGPRQRIRIKFVPQEKGIYVVNSNSSSSVDISYFFDKAVEKNVSWGIVQSKPRFINGKVNIFLLLPPRKNGESRQVTLQLSVLSRGTLVRALQIRENGKLLLDNVKFDLKEKNPSVTIRRTTQQGILQLTAQHFSNMFWFFTGYGEFIICPRQEFAEKFYNAFSAGYFSERSMNFTLPLKTEEVSFAPGKTFQVQVNSGSKFDFSAQINGKTYRFNNASPTAEFSVGASPFVQWDWSRAPQGKLLITEVTAAPEIITPESGTIQTAGAADLSWTPVNNCKNYQIVFRHVESGRTVSVSSAGTSLRYKDFAGKLTPGIWSFKVTAGKKVSPQERFFIIPEPAATQLAYLYGFSPARDTCQKNAPARISVRFSGKSASEIDFAKSFFTVNGKKFAAVSGGADTIAMQLADNVLQTGRNLIKLEVTDKYGNVQECAWSFDYLKKLPVQLSHDEFGNIFFNGSPYYPVIYYGYKRHKLEEIGFNSWLLNSLPNKRLLDGLLARNVKTIDSGCAFKDNTVEQIKKTMPSIVSHPARLAMWCDEIDVHRSTAWITDHLKLFDAPGAWQGICSCNLALYGTMASAGDYLMVHNYSGGSKLFQTDETMLHARKAAGSKPVIFLAGGFTYDDPARTPFIPTIADVEYKAFAALRNRINSLALYQCGEFRMECYPELWKQVTQLYRNFSAISFIAYGKDVSEKIKITSAAGNPLFRAYQVNNRVYVIVQNRSFTPAVIKLQTAFSTASPQVKILFEDRQITSKNAVFTDAINRAGTRIYVFNVK